MPLTCSSSPRCWRDAGIRCACPSGLTLILRPQQFEATHPMVAVGRYPSERPRFVQLYAVWSSAALAIAFVRAHIGHPFARSVVPLIPTVIALTGTLAMRTSVGFNFLGEKRVRSVRMFDGVTADRSKVLTD
jgi:hypothetical protein